MFRAGSFGSVVLVLGLAGCYTLQPARGESPQVGTRVAFDVNDAGRVALGGSMGPEIDQVEGRLLERTDDEYVLAVANVKLLRGGHQVWGGETVRIKSDHVATTYTRRFSRARTVGLAIAGGGAVAFLVTRAITGAGDRDETTIPGDTVQTQLSPRP
jgi:hypothetical protein